MLKDERILKATTLDLTPLLRPKQTKEINTICSTDWRKKYKHPSFILPHSSVGKLGFTPLKTFHQQAFCQKLAESGCIPSCLLLGFSLSNIHLSNRCITFELKAYEYMYLGIEAILREHKQEGFLEVSDYILKTKTLYQICIYLRSQSNELGLAHVNSDVLNFCHIYVLGNADKY